MINIEIKEIQAVLKQEICFSFLKNKKIIFVKIEILIIQNNKLVKPNLLNNGFK